MAVGAYALYIRDPIVGPTFEVLRRTCQPRSRSLPHITVRHAKKAIPDFGESLYDRVWLDRIHLTGPSSFDFMASEAVKLSTVFVRCESAVLEQLAYKPDYPDSVFHLTVYDGRPNAFAASVFQVLSEFPWNFEVTLPPSHVESIRKGASTGAYMSRAGAELLARISGYQYRPSDLIDLDDVSRLEIVRNACVELHRSATSKAVTSAHVVRHDRQDLVSRQGEFWSLLELMDHGGTDRSKPYARRYKNEHGLFITPPEIANDISHFLQNYVSTGQLVNFGDPALGSGIFVASVIGALGQKKMQSMIGIESDKNRATLTADRWRHAGLEVHADDFLARVFSSDAPSDEHESDWLCEKRNLIIANPPYIRFQKLDAKATTVWRDACEKLIGLRPDVRSDMYVYFVLACHAWLAKDGLAAWLLPTEFLFTNYGKVLRDYLTSEVELIRLHAYGDTPAFSNARVSSCVVVYRKKRPKRPAQTVFSWGGTLEKPKTLEVLPIETVRAAENWRSLENRGGNSPVSVEPSLRLGELFKIGRGVATGANKYFVLSEAEAQDLEIPMEWLKPVLPKAHQIGGDVIEAGTDGLPSGVSFSWLIDCDLPIEGIRERAPKFAIYLQNIEPIVTQRKLVRRRHPFYRQEMNSPPSYVFTYMARKTSGGTRFKLNRSHAIALNNYLCMYPAARTAMWLGEGRHDILMLNVLNSYAQNQMLSAGREYAEGLIKLEPRELRDLEVPMSVLKGLRTR